MTDIDEESFDSENIRLKNCKSITNSIRNFKGLMSEFKCQNLSLKRHRNSFFDQKQQT